MPNIKFTKIDSKAIIPKSDDKIHYKLRIIGYDGDDIGINGNLEDTTYYFRTGLKAEIPNGYCLYLHQADISSENDSIYEGLTFKNKISIIYPNDPEIIIAMKRRKLPGNKELDAKTLDKLSGKWVGNLVLRKQSEDVYISFTQFCCHNQEHFFDFLLVNENIQELNLLIDALIPGVPSETKYSYSFSFQALDTNFVTEEINTIEKLQIVIRYNYKIEKFTDKFIIKLLEKYNPNKNFEGYEVASHKSLVVKAIRKQVAADCGLGSFLKNYDPNKL